MQSILEGRAPSQSCLRALRRLVRLPLRKLHPQIFHLDLEAVRQLAGVDHLLNVIAPFRRSLHYRLSLAHGDVAKRPHRLRTNGALGISQDRGSAVRIDPLLRDDAKLLGPRKVLAWRVGHFFLSVAIVPVAKSMASGFSRLTRAGNVISRSRQRRSVSAPRKGWGRPRHPACS